MIVYCSVCDEQIQIEFLSTPTVPFAATTSMAPSTVNNYIQGESRNGDKPEHQQFETEPTIIITIFVDIGYHNCTNLERRQMTALKPLTVPCIIYYRER